MSAKIVTVVATFQARPGQEQALREVLIGLVGPTHRESGCLNYDLHVLAEDPARFLFHENWTSKAQLDAHLANTHIQALIPQLDRLCAAPPEIKLWEKIA